MIESKTNKIIYLGNGINRVFNINFDVVNYSTDLKLFLTKVNSNEITEIQNNFSIDEINKTVTYPTVDSGLQPLSSDEQIVILRETNITQELDSKKFFKSSDVEFIADKLTMVAQDLKEITNRSFVGPVTSNENYSETVVDMIADEVSSKIDTKQIISEHNADKTAHPYLLEEIVNNIEEHNISTIAHQDIRTAIETLQLVKWVDALPETGESKYIYAVPREETDTEGKQIAALYLWDGSAWRGAGAFSLNIDPDTLATKTELAGYLPLSGGTLSDNLVVRKANPVINVKSYGYESTLKLDNSERYDGSSSAIYNIACLEKQLYIYRSDRGVTNSIIIDANGNLARRTPSGNFLFLTTNSKGVANGLASLDASGKVPLSQLPDNIGGGTPTLTWYKNNTGSSITIADTSSANLLKVYKNGVLLEHEEDYSIDGTTLTLTTELISTDKITTEVF